LSIDHDHCFLRILALFTWVESVQDFKPSTTSLGPWAPCPALSEQELGKVTDRGLAQGDRDQQLPPQAPYPSPTGKPFPQGSPPRFLLPLTKHAKPTPTHGRGELRYLSFACVTKVFFNSIQLSTFESPQRAFRGLPG
jgi:hypothetical protein